MDFSSLQHYFKTDISGMAAFLAMIPVSVEAAGQFAEGPFFVSVDN